MPEAGIDMSSAALDRRLRELADLWRFWTKLRSARPLDDRFPPEGQTGSRGEDGVLRTD